MSKPVNPMTIGGFFLGGLVLLVIGLLVFGGGQFFKQRFEYVIYFDSSLNGLNVGAPVKWQGVQVGEVTEIALQMDIKQKRTLKPVIIALEPGTMIDMSGEPIKPLPTSEERRKRAQSMIDAGLRAQLQMQSLLTGLLYVDIDFYPDKPARLTGLGYRGLPEVPSIPTTADELRNTAEELVKDLRRLPLGQIAKDLSETLNEIRSIVKSDEIGRSTAALANSLEEAEKLVATFHRHAAPLLQETQTTVKQVGTLVEDFRGDVRPLMAATERALITANEVLEHSRGAIATVESAAAPDAPLQQAMAELRDAARALRDLADYLERHPDSVLYGKP